MTAICPWCSTELSEGATECPSCGANLVADGEPNVPGVTAVDAASIIRSKAPPPPRNRLLSWISGDYTPDLPSQAESQAIAPPDLEVRREILRLELEAEVANLQAEADALRSEAAAEGRTIDVLGLPEAPEAPEGRTIDVLGLPEAPEAPEAPTAEATEAPTVEATGMTEATDVAAPTEGIPDPPDSEEQAGA